MGIALVAVMELWASTLGQLLKDATSIEVVEVDTAKAGQLGVVVTGRITLAIRSAKATGANTTIQLGSDFAASPRPKERVLVVCDSSQCPRAVGIEKDGFVLLEAHEPMDGALITPPLVAVTSLPVLAQGKPAPPLCVRANLALLDDKVARTATLSVDAATGSGTASATWDKQRLTASVVTAYSHGAGITLGHARTLSFVTAGPLTVDKTGPCLAATFEPDRPVVRTLRSLVKGANEALPPTTFGKGIATIDGKAVPLELQLDEHGQLVLKSGLANGRSDWSQILATGVRREGFSIGAGKRLVLELPAGAEPLVATLAKQRAIAVSIYELDGAVNAAPQLRGTATIEYVKE